MFKKLYWIFSGLVILLTSLCSIIQGFIGFGSRKAYIQSFQEMGLINWFLKRIFFIELILAVGIFLPFFFFLNWAKRKGLAPIKPAYFILGVFLGSLILVVLTLYFTLPLELFDS
jgi:hypothetical protein